MKRLPRCLLALLILSFLAMPALAGLQEDVDAAVAARNRREFAKAIKLVSEIIRKGGLPKVAMGELYVMRGVFWQEQHEYYRAIVDYGHAAKLMPERGEPHNNMAWILATCWNEAYRNGELAVRHAERAVKLLKESAPSLDTLAAAYAEAGRFPEAVATQERVVAMCEKQPEGCNLASARRHLAAYREGQAWRDTSARP